MTQDIKDVLKLALDALEKAYHAMQTDMAQDQIEEAITAIKEALREHAMREVQRLGQEIEQEPIGTVKELFTQTAWEILDLRGSTKVYLNTTPPQRTWVGLTDEEVMVAAYQAGFDIHEDYENEDDPEAMHWWTPDGEACDDSLLKLRDLIEAKLKEKNT